MLFQVAAAVVACCVWYLLFNILRCD